MTSLTAACFICYLSSACFPPPICSFWSEGQILAEISASQPHQGRFWSVKAGETGSSDFTWFKSFAAKSKGEP